MEIQTRIEKLQGQIESQKQIKKTCGKNGDEIGVKRAERIIRELEKEINKLL
jgi:predicted transcriptional regulator